MRRQEITAIALQKIHVILTRSVPPFLNGFQHAKPTRRTATLLQGFVRENFSKILFHRIILDLISNLCRHHLSA